MLVESKRKHTIVLIITYVSALVTLLGVGWVNRNVAPNFSGMAKTAVEIVPWWLLLVTPSIFMRRNKESIASLGFTIEKLLSQILSGVLVAGGSLFITNVIPAFFGINMGYTNDENAWEYILRLIYLLFGVALVEEVVFRGYIFKKLMDIKNSRLFAIIVSSVLFGFFHIFNFFALQIVITTLTGVYWCICREKFKRCTLLSLIIAHALHNLLIPVVTAMFFGFSF